jgi:hypothetical protein
MIKLDPREILTKIIIEETIRIRITEKMTEEMIIMKKEMKINFELMNMKLQKVQVAANGYTNLKINNLVQWSWADTQNSQTIWRQYDSTTSEILENAFQQKKSRVDVDNERFVDLSEPSKLIQRYLFFRKDFKLFNSKKFILGGRIIKVKQDR